MVPFGGTGVMLLGAAVSGLFFALLAAGLTRRLGWVTAWSLMGLLWTLVVIGIVTLVPANGPPGYIPAEEAQTSCSFDIGGPAPDGFWIFGGTQRLLNTLLFVPAGVLLPLAFGRWRVGWVLAPLGLIGLAAYSVLIERAQLELARLDRACDVTDLIDNVTGAVIGFAIGLLVLVMLRPWRHRHQADPDTLTR